MYEIDSDAEEMEGCGVMDTYIYSLYIIKIVKAFEKWWEEDAGWIELGFWVRTLWLSEYDKHDDKIV